MFPSRIPVPRLAADKVISLALQCSIVLERLGDGLDPRLLPTMDGQFSRRPAQLSTGGHACRVQVMARTRVSIQHTCITLEHPHPFRSCFPMNQTPIRTTRKGGTPLSASTSQRATISLSLPDATLRAYATRQSKGRRN